eukprot:TRINITY_DN16319_c2_g1_i1.p1 TRINITY_DN16319_c2_g1~~TRINITY_DN16319_c2_g1_i1.p1  ORF type:complete len:415 (+),score=120.64 TRINITY_DN16319_c2_g1_i1:106-1245(+)
MGVGTDAGAIPVGEVVKTLPSEVELEIVKPQVVDVVPTGGIPAGTDDDHRKAMLCTSLGSVFGLAAARKHLKTIRGRVGAATGLMVSSAGLLVVCLTMIGLIAGDVFDDDDDDDDSRMQVPVPAPVDGLLYSWQIPRPDCERNGGQWMRKSALGPWCSRACPDGYHHREQPLGRPEQTEYCVNQETTAEPKPDLGMPLCDFKTGMRVRLTHDIRLDDGTVVGHFSIGRVTKVPGESEGSAAQVSVRGRLFDIPAYGARCPCRRYGDWDDQDDNDDARHGGHHGGGDMRDADDGDDATRWGAARGGDDDDDDDDGAGDSVCSLAFLSAMSAALAGVMGGAYYKRRGWVSSLKDTVQGRRASVELKVTPRMPTPADGAEDA